MPKINQRFDLLYTTTKFYYAASSRSNIPPLDMHIVACIVSSALLGVYRSRNSLSMTALSSDHPPWTTLAETD